MVGGDVVACSISGDWSISLLCWKWLYEGRGGGNGGVGDGRWIWGCI